MPIRNKNSTNYVHPDEPNLVDLHKAMEYDAQGKPVVRVEVKGLSFDGNVDMTQVEISNDIGNPIPVSKNTTVNSASNPIYTEVSNDEGNPLPISANTSANAPLNPLWMGLGDTVNLTAFSRLRVAEARCIGDYRYMYNQGTTPQMNDLLATGGTITADYARDCMLMNVTGTSGSRAVRQTRKYHPYISGTSNAGYFTFVMDTPQTGLQQMVGLFDDLNGIFFRMNGTTPEFVIRKGGSDTEVKAQADWNKDKRLTLDFTKAQILFIDYQWLGVGRVRIGFVDNGFPIICHEFYHNNTTTEVYMNQPSLPVRYEIKNTTTNNVASTMMAICSSVYVEGSATDISYTKSLSNGNTGVAATNSADGYCVFAVRLQNTLVGKPNRSHAMLLGLSAIASTDCRIKVVILQDATALGGTPTWTNVPGYSWCEYTNGNTMASGWAAGNNYWVIKDAPVQGSGGNNSAVPLTPLVINSNNSIYQNYDSTGSQVFAIVVYGAATVRASFEWAEIK